MGLVPMYDNVFADTGLANFVDPDKDPQYYLDRYYNESTYKSWFDRNYPDITIEDAVGITSEDSVIDSILQKELIKYNSQLADKDFIIAFSKADLMDQELLEEFKGILEKEFKDIMLYQIDEDSGYLRWAIHFYATGSTKWDYWNPPKFCDIPMLASLICLFSANPFNCLNNSTNCD